MRMSNKTTGTLRALSLCVLCVSVVCCGVTYLGREGVVMQKYAYDCGAAALKMVLDYYRISSAYDDLLHQLKTTTATGTSMLNLKQLSERRGLRCEGWRLAPDDLHSVPLPAILFLRRNHFAVLHSFTDGGDLLLLDPSFGKLRISSRRLHSIWEGEILLFYPPGSVPDRYQRWFGLSPFHERNKRI
jgi:ABC-type bacteriocin/lantibiotic exporter with double-glycine peptidase domain